MSEQPESAEGEQPFDIARLCRYSFELSPQPTIAVEGTTHIVCYLNNAFSLLVGKEQAALIGRPFAEAVPEGEENGCLALLDRVFRTGKPEVLIEQEHGQALGQAQPVYWSYSVWAVMGTDERPVGAMIQVTDSTETANFRQQSVAMNQQLLLSATRQHEANAEREAKSREIITIWESMSDAFYNLDAQWNITHINSQAAHLMRRSAEELIGKSLWEQYPAAVDLGFYKEFHRAIEEQVPVNYEEFFPPHNAWYEVHAYPSPNGLSIYFRDITERKQSELALRLAEQQARESEERLGFALESADIGDWALDLRTNVAHRSLRHDQCFGYLEPVAEWGYDTFLAHIQPVDREHVDAYFQRTRAGDGAYNDEFRVTWPDNSEHWLWIKGRFSLDETGKAYRVAGIVGDITERKQAEAALRDSQQRLALATEAAHIGIWDWDVVANKLVWDAQMYALYGIREEDFGGAYEAWRHGLHPEDRDCGEADLKAALEGRREFHTQFRVLWPDGTVRHIEAHAVVRRAGDGTAQNVVGVNWDVTEGKAAEAALVRMRDELEVRVQERTVELARTNADLRIQIAEREAAEAETHTRARQQAAVAELGQRALTDIDMDTLLQGAAALVAATLEVEISALLELMPDRDTFRIRAGTSWKKDVVGHVVPGTPDAQAGYALLHNKPVIVADLRAESRFEPSPLLLEQGIVSGVTVPIRGYAQPFGTLSAHTVRPRSFTQDDVHFLQAIANVLAAAVERKRIETEIRQLNAQLVETNKQLRGENVERQMALGALHEATAGLIAAKEDAEQARASAELANQAKSEFLSRMSHELRTPLNAILGYGQVLEMRDYVPAIQEEVAAILKAGRHLLELINEVLDIARIEAGHLALSLEPVSLGATVLTALDLVRPLAANRQIQLVHEDALRHAAHHVFADQQRLRQVVINLLSNAIKYNREGGQVVLSTTIVPGAAVKYGDSGAMESSGMIRLAVRDTGPGIAPHQSPKLFMPFERLGAERTRIEGTGIGLSLCKRLVEAMHGAIGVESVPGEGSTFWVELPLLRAAPEIRPVAAETTTLPHATLFEQTLTILYIEDNIANFTLIKHALALWGHAVELLGAEQGRIGLELARSHQPDLILLDLHLPDIMGDVVLQRLQAEPATRAIPIIMLSAEASTRQIERLLAAGARAYLTKPLDLPRFFSAVEQILDKKEP